MKTGIDISVFLGPNDSYGVINGNLELEIIPRKGETLSFLFPLNKNAKPLVEPWFPGELKVEEIIHVPNSDETKVLLHLEPIIVNSIEEGLKLSKYMEEGFNLYTDETVL